MFDITDQLLKAEDMAPLDYLLDLLERAVIDGVEIETDLADNATGVCFKLDNGRVLAFEGKDLKVFIN